MNFKNAVRYRYMSSIKSFKIFYGIIAALVVLDIIASFFSSSINSTGPWAYGATVIFIFVVGLNSFKPELKFMLQNGYSRQQTHLSFLCYLPMGIINAVICVIPTLISYKFAYATGTLSDYFNSEVKVSDLKAIFTAFIVFSILNIAALSLGYFISAMYYRLNPLGKVLISVFVPAIVTLVSAMSTSGTNTIASLIISYFMAFFCGTGTGYFYYNHICAAVVFVSAICLSGAHLLIYKAPVKK